MSCLRAACAVTPIFLCPVPVHAADIYFDDVPLVLTASRMAQSPLDAPAPVSIIDRQLIEASGFTEIHDLLRLVPGFLVADWPDGSPTVANHGLGDAYDRRIKVMIDGRTVNNALWGNTNWHDLPVRIDDVERLEVVRGPNGAAYGANAFQGVINIITRAPATESGFTLISRLGDDGFSDNGVRLNSSAGAPIDWRLSMSHRHAVNFRQHKDDEGVPQSEETLDRAVFNFQAATSLSMQDELRLQLGVSDGSDRRGYPTHPEHSGSFPIRSDKVRANYLHLAWTRTFDIDSELTLQYYHQDHRVRSDWMINWEDGSRIPTNIDADSRRDDLEVQFNHRLSREWHMLLGAGVRHDYLHSQRYFSQSPTQRATSWQTFGSLTWQPVDWLRVNAGGTFEHHDYSGKLFSPRLALNFAPTPDTAIRLSTGKAYRAPTLMESRSSEAIRDGDDTVRLGYWASLPVKPEEVRYTELGYVALFNQYGLSLDTRIFHERYSRYIDDEACRPLSVKGCPFPVPRDFNAKLSRSAYYFLNSGEFSMKGLEFSVDWRHADWGRVLLSQAFIDIETHGKVADVAIEDSAPSSMTSLLVIKNLPARWTLSAGYYHNHPMQWLNDGSRIPSRDRYDLKLARRFGAMGSDNEYALTVQSVDGAYAEFHENKFRQESRIFASLRLSW